MSEAQVLRWALGITSELPPTDSIDERRLFSLLQRHRLFPRFFHRLEREAPGWCSTNLRIQLLTVRAQIKDRFRKQQERLREIINRSSATDSPLLLEKGFSTYVLTGNVRHLNYSEDLDVVCRNPVSLCNILSDLGYRISYGSAEDHEFAIAHRGDSLIEVHRSIPVWSYPLGVVPSDVLPCGEARRLVESFYNPCQKHITFNDLIEQALDYRCGSVPGLILPDPATAAFIYCAHEFRHCIQEFRRLVPPAYHRPLSIRLGVLADIQNLLQHPAFNAQRFEGIVERFNGHDTIRFIQYLIMSYFGCPADLPRTERWLAKHHPFPELLGSLAALSQVQESDDLALPANMDELLCTVGASSVLLHTEASCADRSIPGHNEIPWIRLRKDQTKEPPVLLSITLQKKYERILQLHIARPRRGWKYHICLFEPAVLRYLLIGDLRWCLGKWILESTGAEAQDVSIVETESGLTLSCPYHRHCLSEPDNSAAHYVLLMSTSKANAVIGETDMVAMTRVELQY